MTWILIIVGLGLSILQIAVGIYAGLWLRRSDAQAGQRGRLETKRAKQLLDWMRELTDSMAGDVDEHSQSLDRVQQQLGQLDAKEDAPVAHLVMDLVGDIMQSNQKLQDRLTTAEIQLQQQAQQIESHQSRAMTDALTRLPNRRAFDETLARQFAVWRRKGTPLSLMLLDIDHFKNFNDTYGHQSGDKVLRLLAGALQRSLRDMDLVARYGGEEFAVVLPATSSEGARPAALHVLEQIRSTLFELEGVAVKVSASAGIATAREGEDAAELIKRADAALYASKDAGRDCGHLHNGQWCEPLDPQKLDPQKLDPLMPLTAQDNTSAVDYSESVSDEMEAVCDELRSCVAENSRLVMQPADPNP